MSLSGCTKTTKPAWMPGGRGVDFSGKRRADQKIEPAGLPRQPLPGPFKKLVKGGNVKRPTECARGGRSAGPARQSLWRRLGLCPAFGVRLQIWAAVRFHRVHHGLPFAQSRLQVGVPERPPLTSAPSERPARHRFFLYQPPGGRPRFLSF